MFLLYPNHLVILLAIFIRVLKIMMLHRFQRKWAVKAINNHFLFWFLFSRLVSLSTGFPTLLYFRVTYQIKLSINFVRKVK